MLRSFSILMCLWLSSVATADNPYSKISKECPAEYTQMLCDEAKRQATKYIKKNDPKMYSEGVFEFLYLYAPQDQVAINISGTRWHKYEETLPDGRVIKIEAPIVGGGVTLYFDKTTWEVLKIIRGQ